MQCFCLIDVKIFCKLKTEMIELNYNMGENPSVQYTQDTSHCMDDTILITIELDIIGLLSIHEFCTSFLEKTESE